MTGVSKQPVGDRRHQFNLSTMKIKISFLLIAIVLSLSTVQGARPTIEKSSPRTPQSALALRSNQSELSAPTFVTSDLEPLVLLLSGVAVFIVATTARRRRLSEKQRQ